MKSYIKKFINIKYSIRQDFLFILFFLVILGCTQISLFLNFATTIAVWGSIIWLLLFLLDTRLALIVIFLTRIIFDGVPIEYTSIVLFGIMEVNILGLINFALIISGILFFTVKKFPKRIFSIPLSRPFKLFLIIGLITIPLSHQRLESFTVWLIFLGYFMVFAISYYATKDREHGLRFLYFLLYISLIPSILGFFFLTRGIGYTKTPGLLRMQSIFANPSDLAMYFTVLIPIALVLSFQTKDTIKRILLLFLSSSMILTLLLTYLRAAYLGLLISFSIMALYLFKKYSFYILIFCLLVIVFISNIPSFSQRFVDFTSLQGRFVLWLSTFPSFFESPLFGHGIGSFFDISNDLFFIPLYKKWGTPMPSDTFSGAHNDYLRILIELGIMGIIIGIFFCYKFLKLTYNNWKRSHSSLVKNLNLALFSIFCGFIFQAFFSNLLASMITQWNLWAISGIVFALGKFEDERSQMKGIKCRLKLIRMQF